MNTSFGCRRLRAQALVWLTLALPLFVSLAGLAIDGGVLLDERRQLQSVVDGAARAGATQLDVPRLRATGGADVQLDARLAAQTARTYIDQALAADARGWQTAPNTRVDVSQRRVQVQVHVGLPTAFLRIVAVTTIPVDASAYADVQYGIHDGGGG
jgi:uncharacterized membrane protein